jgi:hypothetical protein
VPIAAQSLYPLKDKGIVPFIGLFAEILQQAEGQLVLSKTTAKSMSSKHCGLS